MNDSAQKGFAAIEAVLIVVVLALLGGVGYWVVKNNATSTPTQQASQQTNTGATTPTEQLDTTFKETSELEAASEAAAVSDISASAEAAAEAAANVGESYNENNL